MKTKIFDYGMNGEGVGSIDGKILLISKALKDELVDVCITEDKKNYAFAKLNEIIQASEKRQIPPCPFYDKCGGCSLQHMNYNEQLEFKRTLIQKTLKKICNINFDVSPTIACDNVFNYRNKATFNFNSSNSGFYKQDSKEIVNIESCMLTSENVNKIYQIFKKYLKNDENVDKNIKKLVKNLTIREINNQILVGVVAREEIDLTEFYHILERNFENIGLYLIINNRNDSVVISGKVIHIGGLKEIQINNYGLTYFVDLVGFHQTNINIQDKLYNKVLEFIPAEARVVNGFSGQGLLSAVIAKKAKQVTGIEIEPSSHKSAESLKASNKIKNLKNILGDFGKKFEKLKPSTDIIIIDPSKKGCGKSILQSIIGVKEIIYISCNPIALCKDLNQIKEHYKIENITPFDMFPNTTSVETLVKLKLKEK